MDFDKYFFETNLFSEFKDRYKILSEDELILGEEDSLLSIHLLSTE